MADGSTQDRLVEARRRPPVFRTPVTSDGGTSVTASGSLSEGEWRRLQGGMSDASPGEIGNSAFRFGDVAVSSDSDALVLPRFEFNKPGKGRRLWCPPGPDDTETASLPEPGELPLPPPGHWVESGEVVGPPSPGECGAPSRHGPVSAVHAGTSGSERASSSSEGELRYMDMSRPFRIDEDSPGEVGRLASGLMAASSSLSEGELAPPHQDDHIAGSGLPSAGLGRTKAQAVLRYSGGSDGDVSSEDGRRC